MAALLKRALEEQRFSVEVAHTGEDGLRMAHGSNFDIMTLDVMLPGMDGFEVARRLRNLEVSTPILFLTARDAEADVAVGFALGGDDYLTKPFSFIELLARLRALARRQSGPPSQKLRVDDLVLDCSTHEVTRAGVPIELSRTEYLLLDALMRHSGGVVTRQVLFDLVWGAGHVVENNTLDAFIRLLRRKVDEGQSTKLIQTVRGFGYLINGRTSR
jgi:DNA-binding response OmpR family regulator